MTAPTRGRLTIFLGYAPGVGKTYAMLEAARLRQVDGADAVAAWVSTHHNPANEALLSWLEIIPPINREQIDLDRVLARRPSLALVDDLAHFNPPGMRHAQRYQDVEELLEHGIEVYATVDVFHLESLNDIVFQITGWRAPATLPDRILDLSDEIELVDLPVDDLLERQKAGAIALTEDLPGSFFRKGNLTALRELALRSAAGQVDGQMRDYMQTRAIPGPWAAGERIMVCVSSHPLSDRLVRMGRRLADSYNASWFVVYVETPDRLRFSAQYSDQVTQTLRLAEELGAQVRTVSGRSVPEAVLHFARENNITQIVVGKPVRPRWLEILNGSLVDEIIRGSQDIDVHVITDTSGPLEKGLPRTFRPSTAPARYIQAALLVIAVTLVGVPIHLFVNPTNLVMLYLLAVTIAALYLGRGPSLFAALIGVLVFDFFFTDPRLSFSVYDTQYLLTFFGLLGVGLVVSSLAGQVRAQVEALEIREERTTALYALSRELAATTGLESVLDVIIQHVGQALNRQAAILLPGAPLAEPAHEDSLTPRLLAVRAASPGFELNDQDRAIARWVYERGAPAGRGTDTHGEAASRFQPLRTPQGVTGVLGVHPVDQGRFLSPEQRQLLEAYASLSALAIERATLAEQASQARLSIETEKLQTALLNSISHDLRTPLASITGVFSSLYEAEKLPDDGIYLDPETRLDLIETGWQEADRMNRLVGNLLDMTRLESGALKLREAEGDIEEVIGSALRRLSNQLKGFTIKTSLPHERLLIPMDAGLVEQVLVNVLDNAAKYSPPGSQIELDVCAAPDGSMAVSVADRGPGIPSEDLERIFEKFYRVQRSTSGTGLGLSIAKGMIEAHGGKIWAENRLEGGAQITFTIPASGPPA